MSGFILLQCCRSSVSLYAIHAHTSTTSFHQNKLLTLNSFEKLPTKDHRESICPIILTPEVYLSRCLKKSKYNTNKYDT